jgi:hypothetical protein
MTSEIVPSAELICHSVAVSWWKVAPSASVP